MAIPKVNIGINKFFLSLPIQGRYVEYIISLAVSSLKCMLHLQDIYLESKMHNRHGDHLAKGMLLHAFLFNNILCLSRILIKLNFFSWIA
jgi:hypothetical protein